ncbi:MAG TPA: rRNA maturation RNase YbeY [Oscillospiraceae bacterium]|nr:rRNA maturation RNase YbeY [Oscillospiraceae bacterium]HNW04289.1 rRNA maturation RNase YbeY [Oscillospiraceae bacterium]
MALAKVIISNRQKEIKIPTGIRLLIRRCCEATLQTEGFPETAEISLSFVSKAEIRKLNAEFRRVDAVTDVLSFPLGENGNYDHDPDTGALMLGDVVLCMQKAEEQADLYGHSLQREVAYLTVHSVLHLLGYDHVDGGLEQVRMREREETVLAKLGLQRDASYVGEE